MGRKKKISTKPRYKSFVNIYVIRIYIYTRGQLVLIFRYSFRHQDRRSLNENVAPEFDEDENDGSQFLNLHYHDDEDQDISGEDQDVEEAEV